MYIDQLHQYIYRIYQDIYPRCIKYAYCLSCTGGEIKWFRSYTVRDELQGDRRARDCHLNLGHILVPAAAGSNLSHMLETSPRRNLTTWRRTLRNRSWKKTVHVQFQIVLGQTPNTFIVISTFQISDIFVCMKRFNYMLSQLLFYELVSTMS